MKTEDLLRVARCVSTEARRALWNARLSIKAIDAGHAAGCCDFNRIDLMDHPSGRDHDPARRPPCAPR